MIVREEREKFLRSVLEKLLRNLELVKVKVNKNVRNGHTPESFAVRNEARLENQTRWNFKSDVWKFPGGNSWKYGRGVLKQFCIMCALWPSSVILA